jgi:hypothetical protein
VGAGAGVFCIGSLSVRRQVKRFLTVAARRAADVRPVVHQVLVRVDPADRQRERVVDAPPTLLGRRLRVDRPGQAVGRLRQALNGRRGRRGVHALVAP